MFTGGAFAKWITEAFASIGDAGKQAWHKVTHDPLWAGVAIGVVLLGIVLMVMKKKAAG
ncbi:MAG: hypothetical protein JNM56_28220 [Planctomycetia bacterium]|nr:hypothetical protein [Planctomycetia bacterium]